VAISDGANSVQDVIGRIESMFSDTSNESRIMLSTTHKAKGLERDRVWMLTATYRKRPGVEEDNLAYVAITRARKVLVLVEGLK
jgi:superfamily I DNA/RNA helicase